MQEERLSQLAEDLGGSKAAFARRCDVREERDVASLVGAAEEAFGQPLNIMVANAGGSPHCRVHTLRCAALLV